MRHIVRFILLLLSGTLFVGALTSAIGVVVGALRDNHPAFFLMHLGVLVTGMLTAWFLKPYQKWLFDKAGKLAERTLAILAIGVLAAWLLGALGVSWAPVELFFALGWATMSAACFVYVYQVGRARAFSTRRAQ